MGLAQMQALTGGKKIKRPYVEEINARTRYLPQMYATKKADQYRDQSFALQKQNVAQDKKYGLADLSLREDALDEQKKAQKRANKLGYANIGLGAGLGVANIASDMDIFKPKDTGVAVESIYDLGLEPSDGAYGMVSEGTSAPTQATADPFSDWMSAGGDFLKQIGGGIWDAGKGIYDNIVGDYVSDFDLSDVDWSDAYDMDWTGGAF